MSKSRLGPVSKMTRGRSHQSGQRPFLAWLMTPRIKGKATARPGRAPDHGLWNKRCPSCLTRSSKPHRPPCCSSRVSSSHMPWLLCTCWSLPGCSPTPSSHSQLFVQVCGQMSPPQRGCSHGPSWHSHLRPPLVLCSTPPPFRPFHCSADDGL